VVEKAAASDLAAGMETLSKPTRRRQAVSRRAGFRPGSASSR